MRVLFIHSHYQLKGGEDTVVAQEIGLLKENNEVDILYFQNKGGIKGALQFIASIWNLQSVKIVKNKIAQFNPDIVHVHNWHFALGPLVFRTLSNLDIPVVHTVHNFRLLCPSGILLNKGKLFTYSLNQSFPWSAVRHKVYRGSIILTFWLAFVVWFHQKIGTFKKIDTYICLTEFAVDLFQQSNFGVSKEQFAVKPNFTRVPEISKPIKREKHFLFIGRLSEEKGLITLLDAFSGLPFSLQIAGDGPLKAIVEQYAFKNTNISYLGTLNNEQVSKHLRTTQALVFPSICYETFGLVIIEAFANHTPVLASNIGAPQSLIQDGFNGFLFETGNVRALKEAVIKFACISGTEREQMCLSAYQSYQSNYAPELQQAYFKKIYSSLLANPSNT